MKTMIMAAAAVLALAGAARAETRQFDLVCDGTRTVIAVGSKEETKPHYVFAVDLDRGMVAKNGVNEAIDITPDALTLKTSSIRIDRTKAIYVFVDKDAEALKQAKGSELAAMDVVLRKGGSLTTDFGRCVVAPFSGLAKQAF